MSDKDKLPVEIFDYATTPDWVNYIFVDSGNKEVLGCDKAPGMGMKSWAYLGGKGLVLGELPEYEGNWRNSLTTRPLPKWCKVGEYVQDHKGSYSAINSISGGFVSLDNGYATPLGAVDKHLHPATLRPYDDKELENLVGFKMVSPVSGVASLVTTFYPGKEKGTAKVRWDAGVYTAQELIDYKFTISGKPCGVFELVKE